MPRPTYPPSPFTPAAFWDLLKAAARDWWNDNTFRLAAALAFYTIFSLSPIMLIAIALAGMVFGEEAVTRHLVHEIAALVGPEGGRAVGQVLASAQAAGSQPLAAAFGVVTLVIGSTAVFAELQAALNLIWDVEAKPRRGMLSGFVRDRLLSFAMVLAIGFLLLVSLLVSAALSGAQAYLAARVPAAWLWQGVNLLLSFLLTTGLFMLIYKVLPDTRIAWRDVFIGAVVTALLFSIGRFVIGEYLGRVSLGSRFGAAGSFAVLLVWVYYSALISFFGAEFTQVYSRRYGSHIQPVEYAVRKGGKPDEG